MLRHFSHVPLSATPWTTARQAPRSVGFSKQEYWSGLPLPSPVIKHEVSEVKLLGRVGLFATSWTAAYQASPSMGFSRQEDWSGVPLPSPPRLKLALVNFSVFGNKMFTVLPLRPRHRAGARDKQIMKTRSLCQTVGTRVPRRGCKQLSLKQRRYKVQRWSSQEVLTSAGQGQGQGPGLGTRTQSAAVRVCVSLQSYPTLEYWSGLPFPSPGDLPHPGIKPGSPAWQADSLPPEPREKPLGLPGKPLRRVRDPRFGTRAHTRAQTERDNDPCPVRTLISNGWKHSIVENQTTIRLQGLNTNWRSAD